MSRPGEDSHEIPPELERWLETATLRLAASSRQRVRREIAGHYQDAVEGRCREGQAPEAARAAALEALGSAEAAGRAFRRVLLTEFQAKLLHGHDGRPERWRLALSIGLLVLGVLAVWAWSATTLERLVGAGLVAGMVVAVAAMAFGVPALHRRGRTRIAVLASVLSDWLLYMSLLVGTAVLRRENLWQIGLFTVTFILLLCLYLPLVRKLANRPVSALHRIPRG